MEKIIRPPLHRNNFDFLRLMLASFVIITHSYPLSGQPEEDILFQLTGGQTSLSTIAVRGFFAVSGYLIFQSLMRSRNIGSYLWKRVIRIFPALAVVLFLSTVFCFFAYQGHTPYWANRSTYTYLPKNLMLFYRQQGTIEGVFSANRWGSTINGSLWTIQYEMAAYIILIPLYFIKNRPKILLYLLVAAVLVLQVCASFFPTRGVKWNIIALIFDLNHQKLQHLGSFFALGSLLALVGLGDLSKRQKTLICLSSLALLIVSAAFNVFAHTYYLLLPFFCISFGTLSWKGINLLGEKFGDISYGIYIYAFPVQQFLEYFLRPSPGEMMIEAFGIVLPLAFLSWKFVEKPALSFKNVF